MVLQSYIKGENKISVSLSKRLSASNFNRLVKFQVRSSDFQQMSSLSYRHGRQPATDVTNF